MAGIRAYERPAPVALHALADGGAANHSRPDLSVTLVGALLHQIQALLRDR